MADPTRQSKLPKLKLLTTVSQTRFCSLAKRCPRKPIASNVRPTPQRNNPRPPIYQRVGIPLTPGVRRHHLQYIRPIPSINSRIGPQSLQSLNLARIGTRISLERIQRNLEGMNLCHRGCLTSGAIFETPRTDAEKGHNQQSREQPENMFCKQPHSIHDAYAPSKSRVTKEEPILRSPSDPPKSEPNWKSPSPVSPTRYRQQCESPGM